jgi:putative ABC transport system permease protein
MRRLRGSMGRTRGDIGRDIEDELRFHLDARTEALVAQGLSMEEARAQALREFGDIEDARAFIAGVDQALERSRRRRDYVGEFRQDVAYALRKLRSSPVFSITAIVTLALGIGANTAIFSVVRGVLLRPLPYPDPGQLYRVYSANPEQGNARMPISSPDMEDWYAQRRQLVSVAGYWYAEGGSGVDLTGGGEPQRLSAAFVTAGFFSTLGVPALEGRVPREDEMVRGGPDRIVVLSHGFWQRQFGGSPSVIGTTLTLDGSPFQVLGVMPPSFTYPSAQVDVYMAYSSIPDESIPHIRTVRILAGIARARPGVTIEMARAELNSIARRLAEQYPENASYASATVVPLQQSITGPVRAGLLVLLGAVAFVLLMASVNVASLLLARATMRGREIATRVALGAGRIRIVRQLVTESLVLALIGGVVGIGVAAGLVRGLLWLSADQLPRGSDVHLDAGVLAFTAGISILTGLLFGLVPALRAASQNVQGTLREGGRGMAGGEGRRLRNGLVIAEVALAAILVVAAGLMSRSFMALLDVDPGFQPDNLLAVNFTISTSRHAEEDYRPYYGQVLDRVRSIPGVISAGAVKDAPFRGEGERWSYTTPGKPLAAGEEAPSAMVLHVSDGYFRTIGARIIDGREFTEQDRANAPVAVLVNEALVRTGGYTDGGAVGSFINLDGSRVPIIGVVNDIRQSAIEQAATPTIYIDNFRNMRIKVTLVARTRGEPLTMLRQVTDAIRAIDPEQTITSVFTYDDLVSDALARPRLLTVLLGSFGVLGLILGAVGIYGVLGYVVNQRHREIGVRMALGAHPRSVLAMIVGSGLALATTGLAIGLLGSLALSRYLRGILFGIEPTDPLTFATVALVLLGVSALASFLPAMRAASVDPVEALHYD